MLERPWYRPIRTLSALVRPPRSHIVYVLKAYIDDSGSADDPQARFLTVAGYVADEHSWECFERQWQAALDEAGIPYVHMREFGNPSTKHPVYGALRADRIRHLNFMLDAVAAIGDNLHVCVHATLSLTDFAAFCAKHGLSLDPMSVVIYACMRKLRSYYSREPIEVVFDKFERSASRAGEALEILRSDVSWDHKAALITPTLLQDDESFKTILPLQAADFAAWEIRKWHEDRKSFLYTPEQKAGGREAMNASYLSWVADYEVEMGKPPRERRSYVALRKAIGILPIGVLLDEFNLEQMFMSHPNGWS